MTISVFACIGLIVTGTYESPWVAIRFGVFETVSIATTTGYGIADFAHWPPFIPTALLIGSFVGACAGSTGGGIKAIRILLMLKQGAREVRRLIHPNAVLVIKLGNRAVQDRVIEAVWGFFGVYLITFCLLLLLILSTGMDFLTGFSSVAACINNLGPGLGHVYAHYADITVSAKWILCLAMLLGRLEIFTLLVMLTPVFWRN